MAATKPCLVKSLPAGLVRGVASLAKKLFRLQLKTGEHGGAKSSSGVHFPMVRIRLRRLGTNGRPFYRIVVADQRAARDGSFIELLGTYDPIPNPPLINIDAEKARKWLRNGAQPSESVALLLKKQGLLDKGQPVA